MVSGYIACYVSVHHPIVDRWSDFVVLSSCVQTIKPADIATVRKLGKPPHLIMRIMDAVLILSPAAPGLLYVPHGEAVSVLDPRNLKEPVEHLSGIGEDEINGLSFNDTGTMLAAGDDSGAVRIVEVQNGKVVRTLRRHTNICSSVAFRPQRPQSLVSAGLDMQVLLWNLQKTRPLWAVDLQDSHEQAEQAGRPGQLFNPPLAHCPSRSHLDHQGALQGHSQGASQAHFVHFLPHPYWLLSAGNDGLVALWDVSAHARPPEAKASNSSRPPASRRKARIRPKGRRPPATATPLGEEHAGPGTQESTGPALSFTHTDKVNWVCPALLQGTPSVVVADQSADLYVYPLTL
ncbi:WD repeat-containing protein 53-like [Alosa sapidissima]|uniref:WD repeat-containing protein 53-like n=1 Tax=Alosa sapidissima TaxID=34773 RepID=UPI001C091C9E|nr:WD repeat-containing protein 53-like [Alosa sapidissima]XP_041945028.1 WD repeat-containing protein 53-like [Alosa sapidissima]